MCIQPICRVSRFKVLHCYEIAHCTLLFFVVHEFILTGDCQTSNPSDVAVQRQFVLKDVDNHYITQEVAATESHAACHVGMYDCYAKKTFIELKVHKFCAYVTLCCYALQ